MVTRSLSLSPSSFYPLYIPQRLFAGRKRRLGWQSEAWHPRYGLRATGSGWNTPATTAHCSSKPPFCPRARECSLHATLDFQCRRITRVRVRLSPKVLCGSGVLRFFSFLCVYVCVMRRRCCCCCGFVYNLCRRMYRYTYSGWWTVLRRASRALKND